MRDAARDVARPQTGGTSDGRPPLFAALDLGTNNCRLLIAAPKRDGFRVVDAFSRIVRLGEGLVSTGQLSPAAMDRAVDALSVCARKIAKRSVTTVRCVATAACRAAGNGAEFVERVRRETGLELEIISAEREARLAARGCAELIDDACDRALIFDIGGGSTELTWTRKRNGRHGRGASPSVDQWTSLPIGVVTLFERGADLSERRAYDTLKDETVAELRRFDPDGEIADMFARGRAHLLGTSGTVTSIGGVHLQLPRYERSAVDGLWMKREAALGTIATLRSMKPEERRRQPCVGSDRAELLLAGCAIVEAIFEAWPAERVRIADRGLREGLLLGLMQRRRRRRRRAAKA